MMDGHQQPDDSTLKALVQTYAAAILPLLLEGVTFLETLNVELLRPTMRADRVFKVLYRSKPHILHLEFESGSDQDMSYRLLTYHAIIYTEYYKDNEIMVARQFVWMGIMLRRSDTISPRDKARIQKELRMYDKLWDEDPEIQRIKAEAKAEGKTEAKVEASQEMIVGIVEARFPELVDLAQERVEKIKQLEILNLLAKQIVLAPDEATARWTLGTFAA